LPKKDISMSDASLAISRPAYPISLTENRKLRLFAVFILYVAQGLPIGLFYYALPSWQAQNGASAISVGAVLAMTSLPWSLKLVNGFVMDRFTFPTMGRRRPWLIMGQLAIIIGLLVFAFVNPAANQITVLGALAFSINLATIIQDVAVDGLAVDVIPEEEYGRANGFMFGGPAIGMAAGSAVSGYLIAFHGLPAAMVSLALLVGAILLLVMFIRERPGERLLPWTSGVASSKNIEMQLDTFAAIFRGLFSAMFNRDTLTVLPAIFLNGAACGLFVGLAPLFAANILGWENDTYANWSAQANLAAGIVGALLFGFMAERWGAKRMFILFHLAIAMAAITVLSLYANWALPVIFVIAIFVFAGLLVLGSVTMSAIAIRRCVPAVAATQFSMFMAISNLGISGASASLGFLDSIGGIPAMFVALILTGSVGAMFVFVAKVGR